MAVKPNSDDEESGNETNQVGKVAASKSQRDLYLGLGVFVLLVLLAVVGMVKSLMTPVQDPATIKVPAHLARSLDDDQPADMSDKTMDATGTATEGVIDEPAAIETPVPEAVPTPQTESEIQLTPDAQNPEAVAPEVPALQPEKPVAPQSMIDWNKQKWATTVKKSLPPRAPDQPVRIAVVIDDMGLNRRNSMRLAQMKVPLTLAYMPYAGNLAQQTAQAIQNGHELMVHMPMEPQQMAQNNPGPNALLTTVTAEENLRRLDKNLASFEGYMGLNNHMGSAMTADRQALEPIMADIKRRGLWFLDSRTVGNSVAASLADEMGVPNITRDIFLDNTETVGAIVAQLKQLEQVAQRRGYAVAIGHPYDVTIAALQQWLPQAASRGVQIVPLSTLIAARFPNAPLPRYARHAKDRTSLSLSRTVEREGSFKFVLDRAS